MSLYFIFSLKNIVNRCYDRVIEGVIECASRKWCVQFQIRSLQNNLLKIYPDMSKYTATTVVFFKKCFSSYATLLEFENKSYKTDFCRELSKVFYKKSFWSKRVSMNNCQCLLQIEYMCYVTDFCRTMSKYTIKVVYCLSNYDTSLSSNNSSLYFTCSSNRFLCLE